MNLNSAILMTGSDCMSIESLIAYATQQEQEYANQCEEYKPDYSDLGNPPYEVWYITKHQQKTKHKELQSEQEVKHWCKVHKDNTIITAAHTFVFQMMDLLNGVKQ